MECTGATEDNDDDDNDGGISSTVVDIESTNIELTNFESQTMRIILLSTAISIVCLLICLLIGYIIRDQSKQQVLKESQLTTQAIKMTKTVKTVKTTLNNKLDTICS